MSAGPRVWGANRRDLWIAESENLTDKLKHYLPRLRGAIPNLTDVVLPVSAALSHAKQCREAGFFVNTYNVAHGSTPEAFAKATLAARLRQGSGGIDLDFEGSAITDSGLADYVTRTVQAVQKTNPGVYIRVNVVPHKGKFLPVELINGDVHLSTVAQTYGGNMEYLYAADEVLDDLISHGIDPKKANVMHAVMCSTPANPKAGRQITLPTVRDKGGFYIDDLLLDGGMLP